MEHVAPPVVVAMDHSPRTVPMVAASTVLQHAEWLQLAAGQPDRLTALCRDQLDRRHASVVEALDDLPEVRDRTWGSPPRPEEHT